MVNREELRLICKKLNLHHLSKINTFDIDIKDKLDYVKYLFEYELKEREKKVKKQNLSTSRLPKPKEVKYEGIDKWNVEDALKLKWLEESRNLLIIGKCGKGKTNLASTIGVKAIDNGYKVYYLKVDEYINILKNIDGQKEKIAHQRMKDADLIILDELMYLPIAVEEILLLYRSIMYLSESRSFIFITNRRLEEWINDANDLHTMETFKDRIMNGSKQIIFK